MVTPKIKITRDLKRRILILDGATGTELQKAGMPAGVCPELWCLENPETVLNVHAAYCDAGSDIIYTTSFGANSYKLAQYGAHDPAAINSGLAEIAREAAGKSCLVAGDIGPTGRFIEPFGDLAFEDAVNAFKEQALGLIDGGVDLFAIETMMDIQEARAALIAVKEVSDLFTIVTMTFERDGKTLNGTDPVSALITLQSLGADAVGCNCSAGPKEMLELIRAMRPYAKVPLVAKPNAGLPRLEGDKTVFDMDPDRFAGYRKRIRGGRGLPYRRLLRHESGPHPEACPSCRKRAAAEAGKEINQRHELGKKDSSSCTGQTPGHSRRADQPDRQKTAQGGAGKRPSRYVAHPRDGQRSGEAGGRPSGRKRGHPRHR